MKNAQLAKVDVKDATYGDTLFLVQQRSQGQLTTQWYTHKKFHGTVQH